jgi:hypothetical protein
MPSSRAHRSATVFAVGVGDVGREGGSHVGDRRRGRPSRRSAHHLDGQVEAGILGQDGRLQAAQVGARLEAQLLAEHGTGVLEGGQGLGLAARPVQRCHELAAEALAERRGGNGSLQFGHELGVAPERQPRELDTYPGVGHFEVRTVAAAKVAAFLLDRLHGTPAETGGATDQQS